MSTVDAPAVHDARLTHKTNGHLIRNSWYVVGFSFEFPERKLQSRTVAGRSVVLWRTSDGIVSAFDGRCVHKRFPLSKGRLLEDDTLECAYHGFRFNSSGNCTSIPAQVTGQPPKTARLRSYPVVERDGLVWLWPGEPEKSDSDRIPSGVEITSDEWETTCGDAPIVVGASYQLLIENVLDITHFYPLHAKNIGNVENSRVPVKFVRETINGNPTVASVRESTDYPLGPMMQEWFGHEVVDRVHTHQMMNPGMVRVELRVAPPGELGTAAEAGYVLHHLLLPVDEKTHEWRWSMSARAATSNEASRQLLKRIVDGLPDVLAQDKWAMECQQEMFTYPDEGYNEVHIKTDGAVVMVRSTLDELAEAEHITGRRDG